MRGWVLGAALLALAGCANYMAINTSAFQVGASPAQVASGVGERRMHRIGSKRYESGVVDVFEVHRRSQWDSRVVERYWIYFFNDSLEQWGRPGDWRREADRVYEIRHR